MAGDQWTAVRRWRHSQQQQQPVLPLGCPIACRALAELVFTCLTVSVNLTGRPTNETNWTEPTRSIGCCIDCRGVVCGAAASPTQGAAMRDARTRDALRRKSHDMSVNRSSHKVLFGCPPLLTYFPLSHSLRPFQTANVGALSYTRYICSSANQWFSARSSSADILFVLLVSPQYIVIGIIVINIIIVTRDAMQSAVLPWQVVCPFVCPSVTLRYCDDIGWNSSKIISRLISERTGSGRMIEWNWWNCVWKRLEFTKR